MSIRYNLAYVLSKEGEEDEAKREAKPACLSSNTIREVRLALDNAHLCD
jgi:hypothetical protein